MYLRLSHFFVLFNKWVSIVYLILRVKKLLLNSVISLCQFTLYDYFTVHVSDSLASEVLTSEYLRLKYFRCSVSVFSLQHFCFYSVQF